jgi:putative Holliday junction resolvase
MPDAPRASTLLAFDYGLRRIGVAAGQTITGSASPVGVVSNGDGGPDYERIAALVREWQPDLMVVGLPLNADGSESAMSAAALSFARDLERFSLPVETVDESLTSVEAGAALRNARQAGARGRIRKEDIDAAAAVLIAERYLR